jgi:hypothetical protein
MWKGFLASLGLLAASAGLASAQVRVEVAGAQDPPPAGAKAAAPQPPLVYEGIRAEGLAPWSDSAASPRIWASTEYLIWWIKDGPLPFPIVTTGNPRDPVPGALGSPGTVPLFGGNGLDYGSFSGLRLSLGAWLNDEHTFGVEGSGFLLEQRSVGFGSVSDAVGNPPVYFPVFRPDVGRQGSFTISDPFAVLAGQTAVRSQTRLWGAEVNGLANLRCDNGVTIDALAGFRYIQLQESLTTDSVLVDPVNQINNIVLDQFSTRSEFYGGQLGAKVGFQIGRAAVEVVGKVALGSSHNEVNIGGFTNQTGVGAPVTGTFPGGVFTQRSNIGGQTQNQFAVIPEGQIKISYPIRSNVLAFVGYDFLYWNHVVRPGDQIDRNVNPTQTLGGALTGPAAPLPQFNRSDFWAQGITFGVRIQY